MVAPAVAMMPGCGYISSSRPSLLCAGHAMRLAMDVQAALKAAVEGLAMSGGLEERQANPGMLLVPLLRHQRMALAWMCRRETGASAPWGGILADDQVCPDTSQLRALSLHNQYISHTDLAYLSRTAAWNEALPCFAWHGFLQCTVRGCIDIPVVAFSTQQKA